MKPLFLKYISGEGTSTSVLWSTESSFSWWEGELNSDAPEYWNINVGHRT